MSKKIISAFALGLLIATASCNTKKEEKVLTREISFTKEGTLELIKAENDSTLVSLDIEIAESEYETQTGLMYRKTMENKQGMLFIFDHENIKNFYMKNTEIPLDIIFINKDKRVVNVHQNTVPFSKTSLSSGVPTQYVLEVNAGLTKKWNLAPGDLVSFERN